MDSKYVDLHKIAAIFRGIQEEEYAKKEVDVADTMEDAVEEDNAFNTAAAKAALAGDKEFSFNGKKYPVKMSKEEAKKLMDDAVNSEEPVVEEPKEEDEETAEILKKGMEDEMADEIKDKIEDDEEITNELNVPNDKEKVKAQIEKLMKMAKDARDAGDSNKAYSIERSSEMAALQNKLSKLGGDDNWVTPEGGPLSYKKVGEYTYIVKDENGEEHKAEIGAMDDTQDNYSGDEIEQTMDQEGLEMLVRQAKMGAPVRESEPVTEEPEMVAMDTNTLQQILNLAGLKPVTDADINQPEDGAEPVEEYSNSPEEEYADTDFMTNKLAGGVNRPKKFPNVGNQGHNDLVQRLTKAYNEHKED